MCEKTDNYADNLRKSEVSREYLMVGEFREGHLTQWVYRESVWMIIRQRSNEPEF